MVNEKKCDNMDMQYNELSGCRNERKDIIQDQLKQTARITTFFINAQRQILSASR